MSLVMLVSALVLCSSCLNSSDDNYSYSDDSAVSAFALGNVQYVAGKYKQTGLDSIVSRDFSSVKFRINQLEGKIYNADSLPVGALASKVLCTVSTYNSGLVGLKNADNDTVHYFASTDTVDFSKPRTFIVYSNSGLGYRRYEVSVNVHRQDSAAFVWTGLGTAPEAVRQCRDMRMVATATKLYVAAADGTGTRLFAAGKDRASQWQDMTPATQLPVQACTQLMKLGGSAVLFDGDTHTLYTIADGAQPVATACPQVARLAAAGSARLFAYGTDGTLLASADGGLTWTAEQLDDDASLLPATGTASLALPLVTNSDSERLLIAGTTAAGTSAVWGKIVENAEGSENQAWNYYTPSEDNHQQLPAAQRMQLGAYNGTAIALPSEAGTAPTSLLSSDDFGLTWRTDTVVTMPQAEGGKQAVAMATDSDQFVWLVFSESGQVWRGRQNFLGWERRQDAFTVRKDN